MKRQEEKFLDRARVLRLNVFWFYSWCVVDTYSHGKNLIITIASSWHTSLQY